MFEVIVPSLVGFRRKELVSRVAVSLLLASPLLTSACKNAAGDATGSSGSASAVSIANEPPVHVDTAVVAEVSVPKTLRLTGTLRGARETDLAANVSGVLTATMVERGQKVTAGQVLARVDVRAQTLALAEADVQVSNTKVTEAINANDCARYEQLKKRGVVTDLEYDQVTAKCKTAPGSVEAAIARQRIMAKNLGDGVIRAPFTGIVTERFVDVGEYVQPQSRVASLSQVTDLRLEFSVPEQNLAEVKLGSAVKFRVAAFPEQTFSAAVTRMSGAVRPTRDVVVEASVDNPEGKLLPGMFAALDLVTGDEQLPAVPESAVFEKNGKLNAYVVVNNALEQRVLQPVAAQQGQRPVRRGVSVGEKVVVANVAQLKNGQKTE
jgi:membrane fusion protein, multidrug efflux system